MSLTTPTYQEIIIIHISKQSCRIFLDTTNQQKQQNFVDLCDIVYLIRVNCSFVTIIIAVEYGHTDSIFSAYQSNINCSITVKRYHENNLTKMNFNSSKVIVFDTNNNAKKS